MIIYYRQNGDICIHFTSVFTEPDVILELEKDVVNIIAGDTETTVKRGAYVDAYEKDGKIIIDFDPASGEVEGLEMKLDALDPEAQEIIIKSEEGDIEVKPGEDPKPINPDPEPTPDPEPEPEPDPEKEADDQAAAEGKKCKVNGEYYETLKEAVALAQPGEALEIKMIADETGAGIGLFTADGDVNKDITIDFNGHKYIASSPAVGSARTETQALHLEKDNTVTLKNGEFTSDRDAADIKMLIQNYCDLTLDHMICDCADDASITYVVSNNFGNCLIKDSELHAHPSRVALDCWFGLGKTYDEGLTVTAENSVLDSTVEYGAQRAALNRTGNENWYERTILTLNGCTFGQIVNSGAGANDQHTIIIDNVKKEQELPIVANEE